ncbi:MAG TPA: hypothetical protein VEI26_02815 [Terriglobales bacterium]|nr:hypothetical protein [Terriglobales bacterium]
MPVPCGYLSFLQLEVKHIYYLEIRPVEQNNVTSDQYVRAVRRWRRQPTFQLFGAWERPRAQSRW